MQTDYLNKVGFFMRNNEAKVDQQTDFLSRNELSK